MDSGSAQMIIDVLGERARAIVLALADLPRDSSMSARRWPSAIDLPTPAELSRLAPLIDAQLRGVDTVMALTPLGRAVAGQLAPTTEAHDPEQADGVGDVLGSLVLHAVAERDRDLADGT